MSTRTFFLRRECPRQPGETATPFLSLVSTTPGARARPHAGQRGGRHCVRATVARHSVLLPENCTVLYYTIAHCARMRTEGTLDYGCSGDPSNHFFLKPFPKCNPPHPSVSTLGHPLCGPVPDTFGAGPRPKGCRPVPPHTSPPMFCHHTHQCLRVFHRWTRPEFGSTDPN